IPFSPKQDNVLALVLLCCFLCSAYVLSRAQGFLAQLGKNFLLNRERTSIFGESIGPDIRFLLFFVFQTCLFTAIILCFYFAEVQPALKQSINPYALMGIYTLMCMLFLLAKWVIYWALGYIFFTPQRVQLWLSAYSTMLYYMGLVLFPLIMVSVYFGLSVQNTVIIALILLLTAKILTLYKWKNLFCHNLFDSIVLIVYFCALEIVPLYLFYRGAIQLNDCLTINLLGH
ncbi:MAG: DUF4271 domain-containing protein, partial [Prevotellaceae bacterium]|nr:DUF4271 domain-containing protein [Prevotellaceae bacterium]